MAKLARMWSAFWEDNGNQNWKERMFKLKPCHCTKGCGSKPRATTPYSLTSQVGQPRFNHGILATAKMIADVASAAITCPLTSASKGKDQWLVADHAWPRA